MKSLNPNQLRRVILDGCKKLLFLYCILFLNNAITQVNVDYVHLKKEIKRVTKNTEFEISFFEKIEIKPYSMRHLFPEWSFKNEIIHEDIVVFYISKKKYIYYFLYNKKTQCFISASMTFHKIKDRYLDSFDMINKFYEYNFCTKFRYNCCAEFY